MTELRVLLLPHPAFGHMIPFYQLGLALAKASVHVHYISTPRNIERLPKVPQNLSPFFSFAPVPFPKNTPLPEGAEATVDIPHQMLGDLLAAYDHLEQPVKQLVVVNSPNWLIVDFSFDWAGRISRERGVPIVLFSTMCAASVLHRGPPRCSTDPETTRVRSSVGHLTCPPPWVTFPSKVAYRRFEAIPLASKLMENTSRPRWGDKMLQESQVVAIRSCTEIEGEYIANYAKLMGKPVIPIGLLPRELPKRVKFADEIWNNIFTWMDSHKPKSLVFVGFGSESKLTKDQIFEISYGLEESGLPFIWSLRNPVWATKDLDALPHGFLDRVGGRGKVCFGWAPQYEIMSHPAIGTSLFHAGWGSIIEALQFGHALVLLPMVYDQGLNARLAVEKGLAIEVKRNEDDGSFEGKEVAKCLEQAMATRDESEGVIGMKAAVKDRNLHDRYMDEFVKYLLEN